MHNGYIDGRMSHPYYAIWRSMLDRCRRPKNAAYKNYGGRGITVCAEWQTDFFAFVEAMGIRPTGYVLDRIDNDGSYTPYNCRWIDRVTSAHNTRPKRSPNAEKTHCPRGHPYDEENTRYFRNGRACRTCHRDREREKYRAKKRVALCHTEVDDV